MDIELQAKGKPGLADLRPPPSHSPSIATRPPPIWPISPPRGRRLDAIPSLRHARCACGTNRRTGVTWSGRDILSANAAIAKVVILPIPHTTRAKSDPLYVCGPRQQRH
jgi:hypothetical protein